MSYYHAGWLDDRQVTTHWLHAETLQRAFPKAHVVKDRLYVHSGRVSTSAGSSAGLDLCLSLIRQYYGIDVANMVARRMVAPVHREGGQSQFVEPMLLATDDEALGPILDWMKAHLGEALTLESIADRFAMTLRTFQRRFRNLTGCPPLSWINKNRVNLARGLLESPDLSVEQIAIRSGMGSAANLRKHFSRILETTPRAYRSMFRAIETRDELKSR